jgi:hypothetical protein
MDVPLMVSGWLPVLKPVEMMFVPGAEMSGFTPLSARREPRELLPLTVSPR